MNAGEGVWSDDFGLAKLGTRAYSRFRASWSRLYGWVVGSVDCLCLVFSGPGIMLPMTKRTWIIIASIVAIPVIALGWWLGSPLLLDREVNEDFPMSADAEVPEDMTQEEVEVLMDDAAGEPPTNIEEPMPEETPTVVKSGEFADFDDFHKGRGSATVYKLVDGSQVLRLAGFEVTNGPDLHVLLVPHPDPGSRDDLSGYVDLGSLKGNVGDQNYDIPADIDISEFGSVVIYCEPFHVIFSVATLG